MIVHQFFKLLIGQGLPCPMTDVANGDDAMSWGGVLNTEEDFVSAVLAAIEEHTNGLTDILGLWCNWTAFRHLFQSGHLDVLGN